ncbi:ankyrin repeat domain-containing protein [bacterium]|nr:ankyrin repeat domain-containing protein [bacterium]
MKHILITIITVVLFLGCGPSGGIHQAGREGNTESRKQHIVTGKDVNAKGNSKSTPFHFAAREGRGTFEYCTTIS